MMTARRQQPGAANDRAARDLGIAAPISAELAGPIQR
jgi:hypothetical protein